MTHIVIPVRDQLYLTRSVIEELDKQGGWDKCWIFDNGSEDETWDYLTALRTKDSRYEPVATPQHGIYDMWSQGFKVAKSEGASFVAILNNDLLLAPHTMERLREALSRDRDAWISYPDYSSTSVLSGISYKVTSGTYRHGGMSGFCFMLKAGPIDWEPLVDSRFKWWGGDDDIAFEVEKRGGQQVRVLGLPVTHLMEGTARHYDLGAQKAVDLQAVIQKWGR